MTAAEQRQRFGAMIRRERLRLGWRLTQLEARSGIHNGNISKIENGLAAPTLTTILALSDALDLDLRQHLCP